MCVDIMHSLGVLPAADFLSDFFLDSQKKAERGKAVAEAVISNLRKAVGCADLIDGPVYPVWFHLYQIFIR